MQCAFWDFVKSFVLASLLKEKNYISQRLFFTIYYAVVSALVIAVVGYIVHLIFDVGYFNNLIPYVVLFVVGLILAFLNNIYDTPSIVTTLAGTVIGGIVFMLLLLATMAPFYIVKGYSLSYSSYVVYVLALVVVFSALYWVLTDRCAQNVVKK